MTNDSCYTTSELLRLRVKPAEQLHVVSAAVRLECRPLVAEWNRVVVGQLVGITGNQTGPDANVGKT